MIERIVRLAFEIDKENEFLKVFENHQLYMISSKVCSSLNLKKDLKSEGVYFTHSVWNSEEALSHYRSSVYFQDIWKKIKPWFVERAQAWTLTNIEFES